jgi:uncharacterized protein
MVDKIQADVIAALKSGDKATADALRLLMSAFTNARIALGHDLTDEEATKVIKKEIKSRIEARDLFAANDRQEQADKEEFERQTYAKYVPAELDESAIDALVATAAETVEELSFAKLMPATMQAAKGQADGKLVAERVKAFLETQGSGA